MGERKRERERERKRREREGGERREERNMGERSERGRQEDRGIWERGKGDICAVRELNRVCMMSWLPPECYTLFMHVCVCG